MEINTIKICVFSIIYEGCYFNNDYIIMQLFIKDIEVRL